MLAILRERMPRARRVPSNEPRVRIVIGDARSTGLPDRHFHACITSPPYFGLREYGDDEREIGGEATLDEYVEEMVGVGREVRRVLRDDATWWLNLGDGYAHTGRSGGVKGDRWRGYSVREEGDSGGWKNFRTAPPGVPRKGLLGAPWRVALALQADGWILRAACPWIKSACMPESVRDRPSVSHEYVFLLAKSRRYFWDADAVRLASRGLRTSDVFMLGLDDEPLAFVVNPVPSRLAHFAMWPPRLVAPMVRASTSEAGCCGACGAPLVRERERIADGASAKPDRGYPGRPQSSNGARWRPVIYRDGGFRRSCVCPTVDTVPCRVLDPFGGSGRTAQVARALGRECTLVELMPKNLPIIDELLHKRLDPETMKLRRGNDVSTRQRTAT